MRETKQLKDTIDRQQRRLEKAESERPTLMSHTVFIGTLGLLMVLPVIGGAYLGRWLDGFSTDTYSVRWTIGFIFLGVVVGATNMILFVRNH